MASSIVPQQLSSSFISKYFEIFLGKVEIFFDKCHPFNLRVVEYEEYYPPRHLQVNRKCHYMYGNLLHRHIQCYSARVAVQLIQQQMIWNIFREDRNRRHKCHFSIYQHYPYRHYWFIENATKCMIIFHIGIYSITLLLIVPLQCGSRVYPDRRDAPDGGSRVYPGVKKKKKIFFFFFKCLMERILICWQ